jgi:hypothetical protein
MNEPEGYSRLGQHGGVYYVDVQGATNTTPTQKRVGIGGKRHPDITLDADESLVLLAWLKQEEATLQQLAKETKQ